MLHQNVFRIWIHLLISTPSTLLWAQTPPTPCYCKSLLTDLCLSLSFKKLKERKKKKKADHAIPMIKIHQQPILFNQSNVKWFTMAYKTLHGLTTLHLAFFTLHLPPFYPQTYQASSYFTIFTVTVLPHGFPLPQIAAGWLAGSVKQFRSLLK